MGGLGNQLFQYAAARRLTLHNDAELVLDPTTGFVRDYQYRRQYALHAFCVAGRLATRNEMLFPGERMRRFVWKKLSSLRHFEEQSYITQETLDFDERLLRRKVRGPTILEGYWQSENYFRDVGSIIREDLEMNQTFYGQSVNWARRVADTESVAVHVRWFTPLGAAQSENSPSNYFTRAINRLRETVPKAHFFVFSDDPTSARSVLGPKVQDCTFVTQAGSNEEAALQDFWLMRQCRHFIISNSTFSWWAAWLGSADNKLVFAPLPVSVKSPAWSARGMVPREWTEL
jgi:hypothetical protein